MLARLKRGALLQAFYRCNLPCVPSKTYNATDQQDLVGPDSLTYQFEYLLPMYFTLDPTRYLLDPSVDRYCGQSLMKLHGIDASTNPTA